MDPRRPNPAGPPVYRPFQASPPIKPVAPPVDRPIQMSLRTRPGAPPVYRPQIVPRSVQPKLPIPARFGTQPRMQTAGAKPPTAPPVYKPYRMPLAVQPKIAAPPVYRPLPSAFAAQLKVAAMSRAAAIQLASEKKTSGFSTCGATVESDTKMGTGSYTSGTNVHAEIAALEDYLEKGGTLAQITKIKISSPCCKYCYIILDDLGIRDKVEAEGEGWGSCSPGSYGWFNAIGKVSAELQKKTGKSASTEYAAWEKTYCASVSERRKKL